MSENQEVDHEHMPTSAQQLLPLIRQWLPGQRWYGGKGRAATVEVTPLASLHDGSPSVSIWAALVSYDDGTHETYQLPLAIRDEPTPTLDHVLLGTVDRDGRPGWVYDALHDKTVTQLWTEAIRESREIGNLRFTRHVPAEEVPVGEDSLVLTAEQSNTSLMYGDTAILKVFRRLQPGINPDIEIHAALSEHGARHIARLFGSLEAELPDGQYALGMLQEFMTTATDGWDLAKASVRDLMAEADLHADEAGGDFAGEAQRLGAAVAEVHEDLAAAFGTSYAHPDAIRARVAAMQQRLEHALQVVPELAEIADGLRHAYRQLAVDPTSVPLQRIHGDLHLAQALRTAQRWVIIDFEGEPMATLAERREPDSPLRDVAGMLRSFEYAGHHRVVESGFDPQLAYRAGEWAERNRDAFCEGYAEAAGQDPREQAQLLRAYEADKAVYEAVYEARNRPTWLPIPLASLNRLADQGAA
jgi:maltokinase